MGREKDTIITRDRQTRGQGGTTRRITHIHHKHILLCVCLCVFTLSTHNNNIAPVAANTIAVIENERDTGGNYIATMAEQQQQLNVKSKISVEGKGSIGVKPDLVSIRVGVEMERETAAEALRDNNEIMAKVSGRVSELGVEERDVMTSSVSLNPVYNYIRDKKTDTNKRVLSGFNASNQVTLRIRKLDSVGDVLGALVEAGVNTIDSIRFTAEDTRAAADDARTLAVTDAKRKADVFASAAGYRVASVIEIDSHDSNTPPVVHKAGNARMLMSSMEDSVGAVPIAGGELTVSSSVSIVYQIEPIP